MNDTEKLDEILARLCAQDGRRDLGGRVKYGPEGIAQRHLFGSVASPNAAQNQYATFDQAEGHREVCVAGGHGCARTYVVSLTGREIQRSSNDGSFAPLPLQAFDQLPAGAVLAPRSQLKFRISAQLHSGQRQFFADAGQSFEIQANCICIDWWAPSAFVEVTDRTLATISEQSGFVIDALLGASAAAIEDPIGMPSLTFTTHLVVTAGTQGVVQIPPFATDVTIYQAFTLGTASTMWTQWYGDPSVLAPAIEMGAMPFLPGLRKTQPEMVLPDATHLQSDIAADGADRLFTLRWTCRP